MKRVKSFISKWALMFSAAILLQSCASGIEVGNPGPGAPKLLQGFVSIVPENENVLYRAVLLKNKSIAIQRNVEVTWSDYTFQEDELNFAGHFSNNIEMQADILLSDNLLISSVDLWVNGQNIPQQYQDHLGTASDQVAGEYELIENLCPNDGNNLVIEQAGSNLNFSGAFNNNGGQDYSGQIDSDGYIDFTNQGVQTQATCQATMVESYLSGACRLKPDDSSCLFVYKKLP